MDAWSQVTAFFADVPAGVWIIAMIANVVLTAMTWSLARRRVRRAGERIANADLVTGTRRTKDTALTVAALIPAALFLVMVIAGSMHGLVAFGRDVLQWQDGWEFLVPGTLDGVSVAFGFLAFRAVRRGKAPDRCYRVVWGAASASAAINFTYEFDKSSNALAGGYVGLLSVLGMMMFHEFLAQFEDGAEYIKRQNPKFGLRWVTWPTNTFLAAVAWRNHPPAEGTPATVANAVGNLNRVRQLKRNAKHPHRSTGGHGHDGPKPTAPRAAADTTLAPAPVTGNGRQSAVPAVAISIPTRPSRVTPVEAETDSPEIRVPATEATVLAWAATWVKMSTDDDLWAGPLTDDVRARSRYGRSARQLRRLRQAVLSGALRRQAEELGVTLPEEYRDQPASVNRNTRDDDEPA